MRIVWERLREMIDEYEPSLVVVEHYAPWAGAMGGNAWKTALGYQLSIAAAFSKGVPVYVRRPDDLKRAFLGRTKGTKEETIAAMFDRVEALEDVLADFPEGDYEHMVDAVGHAYLGLVMDEGERDGS